MFRFHHYPKEMKQLPDKEWEEVAYFLSKRTSRSILFGMELAFGLSAMNGTFNEYIFEDIYGRRYASTHFFQGIGPYYRSTDEKVGRDFLRRKLMHMRAKLLDTKHYYWLDCFEEQLFAETIEEVELLKNRVKKEGKKKAFYSKQDYADVYEVLRERVHMKKKEATSAAKAFTRVYLMNFLEPYGECLWRDVDFLAIWKEGFVKGLHDLPAKKDFTQKYSKEDLLQLFGDIGMRIPLSLLEEQEEKVSVGESLDPFHLEMDLRQAHLLLEPRRTKNKNKNEQ